MGLSWREWLFLIAIALVSTVSRGEEGLPPLRCELVWTIGCGVNEPHLEGQWMLRGLEVERLEREHRRVEEEIIEYEEQELWHRLRAPREER